MQTTNDLWAAGVEYPIGIFDATTGAVVGGAGVTQINRSYRIGNIGWVVSSMRTGQGVTRCAAHESAVLGVSNISLFRGTFGDA